jgi:hypothetical protein
MTWRSLIGESGKGESSIRNLAALAAGRAPERAARLSLGGAANGNVEFVAGHLFERLDKQRRREDTLR